MIRWVLLLVAMVTVWGGGATAQDFDPDHKLALYITDNDPAKMRSVLSIATNVSQAYNEEGELVEIRIIAFNEGLHMLRTDTSPLHDRVARFTDALPNVVFIGCGNTVDTMERVEGTRPELVAGVTMVQAGVVELIRLDEDGWTLVRP